jgi:Permuted papain-like amidase enzyme, YaeF/YiiX, C92 family
MTPWKAKMDAQDPKALSIDPIVQDVTEGVSKLAVPEPLCTDAWVANIKTLIRPGDAIVLRRDYEVSNELEKILEGSFYGHAAIYLGGDLPIFEAVTVDGVRNVSLEHLLYTKDAFCLCRLPNVTWTDAQIAQMRSFAQTMIGWKYNFTMDWNKIGEVYCSELVTKIWQCVDANVLLNMKTTDFLGKMQLSPQNLFASCDQIQTYGATS